MTFLNKKNLFLGLVLMLALSVPLTIGLLQTKQETRSRATASTTLSFAPASTAGNPIATFVGDTVALDMKVNPGNNLVTFVKFQVNYDPNVLQPTSNPFTLNTQAFPVKVEGPVVGNGTISESVSIGSDPTKAIQTLTSIGTLNFKVIGPTNATPSLVSFTSATEALSSGPNDQASENVISATVPANISTSTNNNNPSGSPSASLTPQPTSDTTLLTLDFRLHGIGSGGDNPNPNGNELSNKNPLHPQRTLFLNIYNANNEEVSSISGAIIFDKASGDYKGQFDLGQNFPTGSYSVKARISGYLRKLIPGIQAISNMHEFGLPTTELVAGDTNDDNVLNVIDYNAMLDCGYGRIKPLPMADPNADYNTTACQAHTPAVNIDVNDDGIINSFDYNLFLRELSVQNGD